MTRRRRTWSTSPICPECGAAFVSARARSAHQSHHGRSWPTIVERFWPKVAKAAGENGCWAWTAWTNNHGYGTLGDEYAHRISWRLHFGEIPDGMRVLHRCDNPPCVRPDHLFLGTPKDNNADMSAKGRSTWGERSASRILSDDQVLAMRLSDEPVDVLAERFGVRPLTVWNIKTGRKRKRSPGPIVPHVALAGQRYVDARARGHLRRIERAAEEAADRQAARVAL